MRDKPDGAALLDVARQALLDEIAPTLQGRTRYTALMVANAMGIASRELEQAECSRRVWDAALASVPLEKGGALDASARRLVGLIRAGRYDADPTLHAALVETAEVAASILNPSKPA